MRVPIANDFSMVCALWLREGMGFVVLNEMKSLNITNIRFSGALCGIQGRNRAEISEKRGMRFRVRVKTDTICGCCWNKVHNMLWSDKIKFTFFEFFPPSNTE